MAEYACQAAIFELPGNREELEIMLDTMHVPTQDRELVPDARFVVLAVTLGCVRVFRAASVEELLRNLDVLCMEAAPGLLHVWMKASSGTEERILAHMSLFPNQMAPARLQ
jgi:hypothetical protein